MTSTIEIKKENIILYGIMQHPWDNHRFIVYLSPEHPQKTVRINTDFYEKNNGIYQCCKYYDRKLCNTIAEFHKLTIEQIEAQAYGSWMDGAR